MMQRGSTGRDLPRMPLCNLHQTQMLHTQATAVIGLREGRSSMQGHGVVAPSPKPALLSGIGCVPCPSAFSGLETSWPGVVIATCPCHGQPIGHPSRNSNEVASVASARCIATMM